MSEVSCNRVCVIAAADVVAAAAAGGAAGCAAAGSAAAAAAAASASASAISKFLKTIRAKVCERFPATVCVDVNKGEPGRKH